MLSVACYNLANAQTQTVAEAHKDKLDCPADQVVEVIYAHWDHVSIQSIDAVTCKRALLPPTFMQTTQSTHSMTTVHLVLVPFGVDQVSQHATAVPAPHPTPCPLTSETPSVSATLRPVV